MLNSSWRRHTARLTLFGLGVVGCLVGQQESIRVVSAAGYAPVLAPDGVGTVFGTALTIREAAFAGAGQPLPESLAELTVEVNGRRSLLTYASRDQINFVVPPETELGWGKILVRSLSGQIAGSADVFVDRVAPGIFTTRGSLGGSGVVLRSSNLAAGPFDAEDVNGSGVVLSIYCTGLRHYERQDASPTGPVSIRVRAYAPDHGSWDLPVEALEPAPAGVDIVRVRTRGDMDFNGTVHLRVTAGEVESNPVTIEMRSRGAHRIHAVSPSSASPGGRVQISGSGFAFGNLAIQRNSIVLITRQGVEMPLSPIEADADALYFTTPGIGAGDPIGWYRGPLVACVMVDERRVCSAEPFEMLPASSSELDLGELLWRTRRQALEAAVDSYRQAGLTTVAEMIESAGRRALNTLRRQIDAALAGQPELIEYRPAGGSMSSVAFDVAAIRRIEAILAGAQTSSDVAKSSTYLTAAERQVIFGCYSADEFERILAFEQRRTRDAVVRGVGQAIHAAYTGAALACLATLVVPNPVSCLTGLTIANTVATIAGALEFAALIEMAVIDFGGTNYLYNVRASPASMTIAAGQSAGFNVIGEFGRSAQFNSLGQIIGNFTGNVLAEGIPWEKFPPNVQAVLTDDLKRAVKESLENALSNLIGNALEPLQLSFDFRRVPVLLGQDSFSTSGDQFVSIDPACRPDANNGTPSRAIGILPTDGIFRPYRMRADISHFLTAAGHGSFDADLRVRVAEGQLETDKDSYVEGEIVTLKGTSFPPGTTLTLHAPFPIMSATVTTSATGTFIASVPIPYSYCDRATVGGICGDAVIATSVPGVGRPVGSPPFRVWALTPWVTTSRTLFKPLQQIMVYGGKFPPGYQVESRVVLEGREIGRGSTTSGSLGYGAVIPDKLTGAGGVLTILEQRNWEFVSQFFVTEDCELDSEGLCQNPDPTFIQPASPRSEALLKLPVRRTSTTSGALTAELQTPRHNSLVRASIPIFGRAFGSEFREYRIEVGEGSNPSKWVVLQKSEIAHKDGLTRDLMHDSAELTIIGNLANWDTGLKNYVYLPMYPKNHPVDLKGVYTLRLVVTGRNGSESEDSVTVQVGDVVPNAWGGSVVSDDKLARVTVPEHALTQAFRVFGIRAIDRASAPPLPSGMRLASRIYEFREPEEEFTIPVRLDVDVTDPSATVEPPDRAALYAFDDAVGAWKWMETLRTSPRTFSARMTRASPWYAVLVSPLESERSRPAPLPITKREAQQSVDGAFLLRQDFEQDTGGWRGAHGDFGAEVGLDSTATHDGSRCLRITSSAKAGTFGARLEAGVFDAREYPVLQFDYRIPDGVATDLYVKVGGRWYLVRFTGTGIEPEYRRVNIASIGAFENVKANDQWHSARINLYQMLRSKTRRTMIEEMMFADWSVTGTLKLGFGTTAPRSSYFIDNFAIRRGPSPGLRFETENLVIDDFKQKKDTNLLGGEWAVFDDRKGSSIRSGFTLTPPGKGHSLELSFAIPARGGFAGYVTSLEDLDARDYQAVILRVKAAEKRHPVLLGLKDSSGRESKVNLLRSDLDGYLGEWKDVEVPLAAFTGIREWSRLENLSISLESPGATRGSLLIGEIRLTRNVRSFMVDRFGDPERNELARSRRTVRQGNAALTAETGSDGSVPFLRLSYGGNIGAIRSYGTDRFSYGLWATELGGVDCSEVQSISFLIRGAEGSEAPNVYLDDGSHRWGVAIRDYAKVSKAWQRITIPVRAFEEHGVDLSHIQELQLAFEWEKMSGTIYVADVRAEGDADQPLTTTSRVR
jgi:uncharacterized protein (TIGR03437 family)